MFIFLSWVVGFIGVLIMMPFFTLYERKILSYMQKRKGPKKVSIFGLLQPVADGVKLIVKELSFPKLSNFHVFWFSSLLSFMLMVFSWFIIPFYYSLFIINLSVLGYMCMTSFAVYSLLGAGWGSNSKYSLLGSIRGACQVMSYEVGMMFLILFPASLWKTYKMWAFYKKGGVSFLISGLMLLVWLLMILAETKRAPFDFAEGESELVSGFKTEYSALPFAYLFLGEYGSIILISFMTTFFFIPYLYIFTLSGLLFSSFFIWARGTFPRFRYDFLMVTAWKYVLPIVLLNLGIMFFMK